MIRRIVPRRWSRALLALIAMTVIALPGLGDEAPGEPELNLSWRAPAGLPRAADGVVVGCGESARPETLYLSFDPGRGAGKLYGMEVTLLFQAPPGDTLGSFWRFGGGSMNRQNIQIQFPPADGSWGCAAAFGGQGLGAPHYELETARGQLQIMFAVPAHSPAEVRGGERHCFARIVFPRPLAWDERCGRPVCIEWASAQLAFAVYGPDAAVAGRPVRRFVTWNSPGGDVCRPFRAAAEADSSAAAPAR